MKVSTIDLERDYQDPRPSVYHHDFEGWDLERFAQLVTSSGLFASSINRLVFSSTRAGVHR